MTETTNATHTPGPWTIGREPSGGPCVIANGYGWVARVRRPESPEGNLSQEEHDATAIVNARLIAAAPDLLEACKALVKWMDDSGLSHVEGEGTEYSVVRDARAAIAKAEGAD